VGSANRAGRLLGCCLAGIIAAGSPGGAGGGRCPGLRFAHQCVTVIYLCAVLTVQAVAGRGMLCSWPGLAGDGGAAVFLQQLSWQPHLHVETWSVACCACAYAVQLAICTVFARLWLVCCATAGLTRASREIPSALALGWVAAGLQRDAGRCTLCEYFATGILVPKAGCRYAASSVFAAVGVDTARGAGAPQIRTLIGRCAGPPPAPGVT